MPPRKKKKRAGGAAATAGNQPAETKPNQKRKHVEEPPEDPPDEDEVDDEEGEEEDEEDQAITDQGNVDMDFELLEPDEKDYHPVGELLKGGTFDFVELNYVDLIESVIGQGNIGTLVKTDPDGDEEVVSGMLTALNMKQFAHLAWPKTIKDGLLAKARKHADKEVTRQLETLLDSQKTNNEVGLIINERFMNLPLELVPQMHKGMKEDIEWSCSTPECPPEERPFYRFTHFVGVARCFGEGPAGAASSSAAPVKTKKQKKAQNGGAELVFASVEDEFYMKRASFSFTFPMPPKGENKVRGAGANLPERRMVFGITRKDWERVVAELPAAMKAKEE